MRTRKFDLDGRFHSRRGLSLLELFVAMSLLLVLVALLLPAVKATKEKTKLMKCMNNMRQIGSGVMLYAADQGHFPHSSHFKYWADWAESIIPYMDRITQNNKYKSGESWAMGLWQINDGSFQHLDNGVGQGVVNASGTVLTPGYDWFTCPNGPASIEAATYKSQNGTHRYSHNYSCNEYLMPPNHWSYSPKNYDTSNWAAGEAAATTDWNNSRFVVFPAPKPSELQRPGSLILICETGVVASTKESFDTMPNVVGPIQTLFAFNGLAESANGNVTVPTPDANNNDTGLGEGWPIYSRHNGRCVTLMADGHVELLRNGEMKRRNFVSNGKSKEWGGALGSYGGYVEAYYP